jgi:hypothetical protein
VDGAVTSQFALEVVQGGTPPAMYANTESWNGTSWTELNDLSTAKQKQQEMVEHMVFLLQVV